MTSEVIPHFMKKLRLHNLSNHRIFYQNQFINELLGVEELTLLMK